MKCERVTCWREIEGREVFAWLPENFGRYGKGALKLCEGCWWLLDAADEPAWSWAREEAARRWPIGVDRPRETGESREKWIRRQARVYTERTGVKIVIKRGAELVIGAYVFTSPAFAAAEAHMTGVMDGEIDPVAVV